MSATVTRWVLRHGPRPEHLDRGGRPYGRCHARALRAVLMTVANAADETGENAYPGLQAMMDGSLCDRALTIRLVARLVSEGWLGVQMEGDEPIVPVEYQMPTGYVVPMVQPAHCLQGQQASVGEVEATPSDDTLRRLERISEIHQVRIRTIDGYTLRWCIECQTDWPCGTARALAGSS